MLAQNILAKFNLYTDDMSQLSSVQEYELLNTKYRSLSNERDWEWLREIASVTISGGSITLPTNFKTLAEDFTAQEYGSNNRFFFWIGDSAYPIINMKNRRDFSTFSYMDVKAKQIVLQDLTITGAAEFDYYGKVVDLATGDEPVFSDDYHEVLYHMMCIDHEVIDQSEKARSQKDFHEGEIKKYIETMTQEDGINQEDWS